MECDQENSSKQGIQAHKLEVHGRNFDCNKCTFKTKDKPEFMKHKTTMHLNVVFKCQSCTFEAKSKDELKKHIDDVHETIEVVIEEEPNRQEEKKKTNDILLPAL